MIFKKFILCICALVINLSSCSPHYGELNLDLVQVLFRHGERAPQKNEVQLISNTTRALQEPWGYAQLTNTGKLQEYRLGEMLRQRYDDFLGDAYRPDDVYACSSDFDRTKASLQLVLASLYPPTDELTWNEDLRWMPIPIHFAPRQLDPLFFLNGCSKYTHTLKQVMTSRHMKKILKEYEDLFKYLSRFYPNIDFDLEQLFFLNNLLNIQVTQNVPVPDWYTSQLHARIAEGAKFYLDTLSYTPNLIQLNGGSMTRRLLENIELKSAKRSARKIYLYSGHEYTVYAVAKAHNVTLAKSPAFGSALIQETLRDHRGKVYVRMFLWTGVTEELYPINLHNCDELCPIKDYLNLVYPLLPTQDQTRCLYKNLKPADLEKFLSSDVQSLS